MTRARLAAEPLRRPRTSLKRSWKALKCLKKSLGMAMASQKTCVPTLIILQLPHSVGVLVEISFILVRCILRLGPSTRTCIRLELLRIQRLRCGSNLPNMSCCRVTQCAIGVASLSTNAAKLAETPQCCLVYVHMCDPVYYHVVLPLIANRT